MSAAELSRKLKIPYPFLRAILQALNAARVVTSSKGKGGGFSLARSPEEIYLTDLIRIFQGPIKLAECLFQSNICPNIRTCQLRKTILKLQRIVVMELKTITLAGLLEKTKAVSRKEIQRGR